MDESWELIGRAVEQIASGEISAHTARRMEIDASLHRYETVLKANPSISSPLMESN